MLLALRLLVLDLLLLFLVERLLDRVGLRDCLVSGLFHLRLSLLSMFAIDLVRLVEYLVKSSEDLLMDKLLIHTA